MVDGFTRVPPDSTGDRIDTTELTVSALTVQRQRVTLAGAADVDLCPVDATDGVKVNLGADNDVTANAGTGDYLSIFGHIRNESFKESAAIGGELDDTAPVVATEGNVSPVRITAQRGMHVNLRTAAGVEFPAGGGTEAAALRVTMANDSTGVMTVDAASLPLPAGAATSALQLANGHDVTIDNAAGGAAVNIQDGGNTITVDAASLPLPTGAATSALQLANGHDVTIDNAGAGAAVNIQDGGNIITVDGTITANAGTGTMTVDLAGNNDVTTTGNVAHDAADAGDPVKIGMQAAEFAANPPQVSADSDRVNAIATPQGMQWVIGGHPNIISREYMTTGAQTNDDMIGAIAAGSHVVLTEIEVLNDTATTTDPQVRIGFGTTTVPTEPTTGNSVAGVVLAHGGIAAGSGIVRGSGAGMIAVGGSGEELRITCAAPTSGKITVIMSYYITTL